MLNQSVDNLTLVISSLLNYVTSNISKYETVFISSNILKVQDRTPLIKLIG